MPELLARLLGWNALLHSIFDDLFCGRSVILSVPSLSEKIISRALWASLGQQQSLDTIRLFERDAQAPIETLSRHFNLTPRPATPLDVATHDNLAGRVAFACTSLNTANLWRDFLNAVGPSIHGAEPPRRCRFLLTFPAQIVPPRHDAWLCIRTWDDTLTSSDLLTAALLSCPHGRESPTGRILRAHLVARIALWDLDLARDLARAPLSDLVAPLPVLLQRARDLGWDGLAHHEKTRAREEGALCVVDGAELSHSAWCAANNQFQEIRRRLWAAQVSALFEKFESFRHKILLEPRIRTAHRKLMPNRDYDTLELTDLVHLSSCANLPPHERNAIRQIRDARNCLAHFEPIDHQMLTETLRLLT